MEEVWKPISDFPDYEVSSLGRVKSYKTGKILKPSICSGYYRLILRKPETTGKYSRDKYVSKCVSLHRLLGEAFVPNPENHPVIDHINRNRLDNTLSNLRWVTYSQNILNSKRFDS